MCQGENTKFVEDICSVGDGGKQPVNVVLVDALGEESDNRKEVASIGAKLLEHGGGE